MEFRIADTFTDSLAKFTGEAQKAANGFRRLEQGLFNVGELDILVTLTNMRPAFFREANSTAVFVVDLQCVCHATGRTWKDKKVVVGLGLEPACE